MLNINPAEAEATAAQTADAYAAQAIMRPLAGLGAGAFMSEGTRAGLRTNEIAAASALPGVKSAGTTATSTAITSGNAQASVVGAAFKTGTAFKTGAAFKTSVVDTVQADSVQLDTHNFIQTARLYPATRGGVGPHRAREPEPV